MKIDQNVDICSHLALLRQTGAIVYYFVSIIGRLLNAVLNVNGFVTTVPVTLSGSQSFLHRSR